MIETVNGLEPNCQEAVNRAMARLLDKCERLPVLLCIGSDKVTGDCLVPMLGHLLTRRHRIPAYVYGTLEVPVTAKNLDLALSFIRRMHPKDPVLAVDAALGQSQNVGLLTFRDGPLLPGQALSKTLPAAGDLSVTAIVNASGPNGSSLFATPLRTVMRMAEILCASLTETLPRLRLCAAG